MSQTSAKKKTKPSKNSKEFKSVQSAPRAGFGSYLGIFLTASAVILFELALTRVFAVMLWAHLAFMVVGTALFGFGLSGVVLALWRRKSSMAAKTQLTILSVLQGMAMLGCYAVIRSVPFKMWKFSEEPMQFAYLAAWYAALVVPFFVAGLLIAKLLSTYYKESDKLYGVDLVGAALGALALILMIPFIGGEGSIVIAAALSVAAGLCYCPPKLGSLRVFVLLVVCSLVALAPKASELFPLKIHETKRRFNIAQRNDHISDTLWSPLSRVDVAYHNDRQLDIWIDGGTNESAMLRWDGDLENLKPINWSSIATSYHLKEGTNPRAMIIGSSGGREVLIGLSHGASHIDAVEMDPSIAKVIVNEKYAEYNGNLFSNDRVTLVNDEGRSFVRRQPLKHYDIIQSVNNYTPVALSSGALNLSAAFLLTKESIADYLDHLSDDGILALHRGATLRTSIMVMEVLAERGISNPNEHILITAGEVEFFEGFFLKKSPWTKEEVEKAEAFLKDRPKPWATSILWNPINKDGEAIFQEVLQTPASELSAFYNSLGVSLEPPTDNKPFMEHFIKFGKTKLDERLPVEFKFRDSRKWRGIIPRGDFPFVAILAESALLALFFVALPLLFGARSKKKMPNFGKTLTYFSGLGFGFIVVEICLMKRYVLFLGNPAYSITTVLVALLCGAGLGSICSSAFSKTAPNKVLKWVLPCLLLAIAAETLISPILFENFLAKDFNTRVIIASAMLLPLGFLMGMPFPLGLRQINETTSPEQRPVLTAWAWGMNGYWTVIGSAATVFIAVFGGFKTALIFAMLAYFSAYICVRRTA